MNKPEKVVLLGSGALRLADDSTLEVSADQARIKDLGVTTAKLNDLAVVTGKVADDAITQAKLADQEAKVSLAGTSPVLADLTGLDADGKWALGEGTGGEGWLCVRVGTDKFGLSLGSPITS